MPTDINKNRRDLSTLLSRAPHTSKAPCRVDIGGTWDIKAFSLPWHYLRPSTVNVALSLYTSVTLVPDEAGWISVESEGFDTERHAAESAPFNTPLGFVFAVATYFNVSGVRIKIRSESPPRSALGGSGVLGVALIHAFSKVVADLDGGELSRENIVRLAYELENGLSVSLCGMQDQAGAAFGGINQWIWMADGTFVRNELVGLDAVDEFKEHMLVAYCGQVHDSVDVNSVWLKSFVSGYHRESWFKINALTHQFAAAIRDGNWRDAIQAMNLETELRIGLTPSVLVQSTNALVQAARDLGCGARFCGAGGGGCVWALGERDDIVNLRHEWSELLDGFHGGRLLEAEIDSVGVR